MGLVDKVASNGSANALAGACNNKYFGSHDQILMFLVKLKIRNETVAWQLFTEASTRVGVLEGSISGASFLSTLNLYPSRHRLLCW